MRTAVIILAGFVLWAVCIGVAKLIAGSSPSSTAGIFKRLFL
jgi:hypothetical protein